MITTVIFIITFGILNRARGTRLYDLCSSTSLGRVVSMTLMGIAAGVLFHSYLLTAWLSFTLLLWCVFAWDRYWEATIGGPVGSPSGFFLVDYIMSLWPLPAADGWKLRAWGTVAMALRMMLVMPAIAGTAFIMNNPNQYVWALGAPMMAVPYLMGGYIWRYYAVMMGELGSGMILGLLIYNAGVHI